MKTISIRELHERTGAWVRKAVELGAIIVTERGKPIVRLEAILDEGKLADQDPSDEPASVLLERIRTETAGRIASATSGVAPKRRGRRGTMTGTKHTIG